MFPGGKVDNKESFITALLREVFEEIGFSIYIDEIVQNKYLYNNSIKTEIKPILAYESAYPVNIETGNPVAQSFVIFFVIKIDEDKAFLEVKPQPSEVDAFSWIDVMAFSQLLNNNNNTDIENSLIEAYTYNELDNSYNIEKISVNFSEGLPFGHNLAFNLLLNYYLD